MRNIFYTVVALLLLALAASPAHARQRDLAHVPAKTERRIALVIGNGAYRVGRLKNPINDARDIARVLRDLGFEVMQRENLTQAEMKGAIREFGAQISRGGVGLFYFAGHGVQVNGRNYLIPVDSAPAGEDEIEFEAVDANFILAKMDAAGNDINIVILDACRNNPFARSFRSTSEGLTAMSAPTGTLIAYATSPGKVASDGPDASNGIYTQELLRHMRTPGISIEEVFKRVARAVNVKTLKKQTPWVETSLIGDFYFVGRAPGEASAASGGTPPRQRPDENINSPVAEARSARELLPFLPEVNGSLSEIKDKRKVFVSGMRALSADHISDEPRQKIVAELNKYPGLEVVNTPEGADFEMIFDYTVELAMELPPLGREGIAGRPSQKYYSCTGTLSVVIPAAKNPTGTNELRVVWQRTDRRRVHDKLGVADTLGRMPKDYPAPETARRFIKDLQKLRGEKK